MMRHVPLLVLLAASAIAGGVVVGRTTYRYAEAQALAGSPPLLDAGPGPVVVVASPLVVADMAVLPEPVAPAVIPPPTPAPETETPAIIDQVARDVAAGNWRYAAAGALSLLMIALQRARARVRWFAGRRGGAVLVMVLALAGSLATVLASSVPLTPGLLFGTFTVALTAIGGWEWVRAIVDRGGVAEREVAPTWPETMLPSTPMRAVVESVAPLVAEVRRLRDHPPAPMPPPPPATSIPGGGVPFSV